MVCPSGGIGRHKGLSMSRIRKSGLDGSAPVEMPEVESGCMLEYLGIPWVPAGDLGSGDWINRQDNGDNPRVQAISREAVVGPSETTRPTPSRHQRRRVMI